MLADCGMDCARINFSHGTKEDKEELFENIRTADARLAVLCDIQGPKIRIGRVKNGGAHMHTGNTVTVTTDDIEGDEEHVSVSYKALPDEIKTGDLIFINDGIVCLKTQSIKGCEIVCKVLAGGYISTGKGVNLPSTKISLKVPTEKDLEDLKLISELNPEYVAISFVNEAKDVRDVRTILSDNGNDDIKLVAKIERPSAVENFDSILKVSDGIMVARGDLGVELNPEQVLPVQKSMIRKCNIAGIPVIIATQMLESMVKAPVPTRAEVSDVFNAIEDGADVVMLSAETANGDYPREAVTIMERIIRESETLIPRRNSDDYDSDSGATAEIIGNLVYGACKEFKDMEYEDGKIICLTRSGYTARMISKYRPPLKIFGVTPDERTFKELKIIWGVEPVYLPQLDSAERTIKRIELAVESCMKLHFIEEDEKLIIAGNFFDFPSQTNMISIFSAQDVLKMA